MHKIGDDTPTANGAGEFKVDTDLMPNWLNMAQRELAKLVEGAGLVLDPANDNQLYEVLSNGMQFFAHGEAVPSMKVVIEPGQTFDGQTHTTKAQQITPLFTAPVSNPRIDRIAIDKTTGNYVIITGTEAASPVAPDYGYNHFPICQFRLETTTITISNAAQSSTNAQIINEQALVIGSAGAIKFKTADESVVSSITPQPDDHLTGWNLVADKRYRLKGVLYLYTVAGFRITHNFSNAPLQFRNSVMYETATALAVSIYRTASVAISHSSVTTAATYYIDTFFQAAGGGTPGGTLGISWAQDTSNATPTVMYEGSYLELTQLD